MGSRRAPSLNLEYRIKNENTQVYTVRAGAAGAGPTPCYDKYMIYEIIAYVLLIDSTFALLLGFTRLGDNGIEKSSLIRRYLPLTKGWVVLYFVLSVYVAYLTFSM